MSFASLFSGPPNKGLPVADCASNERETAGAVKAEINLDRNTAAKKKRKKKKKGGGNGWIDVHSRNGQQKIFGQRHITLPSHEADLDEEHRPRVRGKVEWYWNYNGHTEDNYSSVNRRKRKKKWNNHSNQNKTDFACEEDQDQWVSEAAPPTSPPFSFPRQMRGLSLKKEKKIDIGGHEKPRKTRFRERNQEMPGPGQIGRGQRGRDGGGMSQGHGFWKNKPYGRNCGNGRGRKGGMGEAKPKEEKKVFLSEDYINRHTVEAQGRRVCKYFLRGTCVRGDQCNFEHATNVKMMAVCKFYVQGYCTKDPCIYMHEEFPCRFFHTGTTCYQGDACRFSHEPLTDLTRELLEQSLNPEPVKTEESDPMVQDDSSFPLPPSPLPPVAKLTIDMADNVVTVRPNFYNSTPLTECQPQGSSTLPQSWEGLNIQSEKRTIPARSPGLERRPQMQTHSPAVPHFKMERNLEAVQDELLSSPVEEGPKPVTSVLKTLFLHLCSAYEDPQNSARETGVSASASGTDEHVNEQPGTLPAKKTQAPGMVPINQGTDVCDRPFDAEAQSGQHKGESAPFYTPLSAQDRERKVEEEGRLRDKPVLVPLDAIPGMARRDPRPAPRAAAVTLPLPPFAYTVERDAEEPVPLPPQVGTSPQSGSPTRHFPHPLADTPEHASCSWTSPRNLPQVAFSAVHKLPVPALAGLIHPTYSKGRAVKSEGEDPAARETQTKGNVLKGLFTTLLPAGDL
ncbi:uncharacterized protein LOC135247643 [Anguilla rostrata]|uniref:uncharacterized protein LOC135247643 n=1 Tax=Anguilla rostrata TaxID=7938 RepID=UPI0030D0FA7D